MRMAFRSIGRRQGPSEFSYTRMKTLEFEGRVLGPWARPLDASLLLGSSMDRGDSPPGRTRTRPVPCLGSGSTPATMPRRGRGDRRWRTERAQSTDRVPEAPLACREEVAAG